MTTNMKRTTIFLTGDQHQALRRIASERRTSMARLIRDMTIKVLEDKEREAARRAKAEQQVLTKESIKDTLRSNRDLLRKYNVSKIGLFGSYVRREAKKRSDIDLLVDFSDWPSLFEFARLKLDIEALFKKKVDLGTPDGIKPYVRTRILQEVEWIEGI